MATEIRSLAKSTFYLYIIQGFNYIFPVICLPYLIKSLTANGFGIFAFAQAFAQFIILFVDFGFNITAAKRVALESENGSKVNRIFYEIIYTKLVLFLAAFLVLSPVIFIVPNLAIYRSSILINFVGVFGSIFFPVWLFQGMNKLKELSIINIVSKFLTFPLLFLLVKTKDDFLMANFIYSLALFVAAIIATIYLFKRRIIKISRFKRLSVKRIIYHLQDSGAIFISNSAISLYTNGITIVLGFFAPTAVVGLFGALDRIVRMICFSVFAPINQASFPILANLSTNNPEKSRDLFRKILIGTSMLIVGVIIFFYIFEAQVIHFFFKGYADASFYLRIFIFTVFPIAIGGVLGQLGLIAIGREREKKVFSRVYMCVGFILFPLSFFLIKLLKLEGAVASMMIAEFFVLFSMFYFVRKYKILSFK